MSSDVIQSTVRENIIHIGAWTDWSHGAIAGATLTLTKRNGGLLIAFIALFVTVTGDRLWNIVSFIAHMILSREDAQDGIYHQRQAILRNTTSSSSGLWKLLQMSWAWRRHRHASLFKRIFPSLLLSIVTLSTFAVAGIFSSRVATSTGGEALISSPYCGWINPHIIQLDAVDAWNSYGVHRMQSSFNYALLCYGNTSSAEDCPTFTRQSLPFNVTRSNVCPFPGDERICRNSSGAVRLDSGFIKSHSDLGINAPPENRFLYRSVIECAPLRNEGYSRLFNFTRGRNSSTLYPVVDFSYGSTHAFSDSTYRYSADLPLTSSRTDEIFGTTEYVLHSEGHYADLIEVSGPPGNSWDPIPELQILDGDVIILFLSANDIQFLHRVDDPWYSAHTMSGDLKTTRVNGSVPLYARDDPVRVLGCIERYQFCNPNAPTNSSCTNLGGIIQAVRRAPQLYHEEAQRAQMKWSASAIGFTSADLKDIFVTLGTGALQSRSTLSAGVQSAIPDNQWEVEVESWFKLTMADLQRAILELATGPTEPAMRQFLVRPNTTEEHKVCANQKIRSDSFTSFNILGLTIILALGGLITLMSFVLPMAVERVQRRHNPYSSLEWIVNDTLQLQRLAHEAVGAGTWRGTHTDYPTTAQAELLAMLDVSNPKHPNLKITESKAELFLLTGRD